MTSKFGSFSVYTPLALVFVVLEPAPLRVTITPPSSILSSVIVPENFNQIAYKKSALKKRYSIFEAL